MLEQEPIFASCPNHGWLIRLHRCLQWVRLTDAMFRILPVCFGWCAEPFGLLPHHRINGLIFATLFGLDAYFFQLFCHWNFRRVRLMRWRGRTLVARQMTPSIWRQCSLLFLLRWSGTFALDWLIRWQFNVVGAAKKPENQHLIICKNELRKLKNVPLVIIWHHREMNGRIWTNATIPLHVDATIFVVP